MSYTKHRFSNMDQENAAEIVKELSQTMSDDDLLFFRPYVPAEDGAPDLKAIAKSLSEKGKSQVDKCEDKASDDDDEGDKEEDPVFDGKQKLLFVHMFSWQRRLLERYGNEMCLLDATYKTCRYSLPLFLLCVKTSVDYQVVATFIIMNETAEDIAEALTMIKEKCPGWKPKFFMVDKSDAEIAAIEEWVFKGLGK